MQHYSKVYIVFLAIFTVNGEIQEGKIVGGREVDITNVPFQLSLLYRGFHICGASLIGSRSVLTAAHCVIGYHTLPHRFKVKGGSSFSDIRGKIANVSSIHPHKFYNANTSNYDIAVIKLSENLPFGPTILPIALPEQDELLSVGTFGFVCGWGYTQEKGNVELKLRRVEVQVISNSYCRKLYKGRGDITHRMFCAGNVLYGGQDACQGDSGGPMVGNGKLLGIVSWGNGCGKPGFPGVYCKVSKFRNWISSVAGV